MSFCRLGNMELPGSFLSPSSQNKKSTLKKILIYSQTKGFPYTPGNGYFLYFTQQTFQRRFNVVFRLIWRCNVAQRQINVKTTLCTSTLKLQRWTTSSQRRPFQRWFEQRQATSKQCFYFQHRFLQRWATLKQRCEYDHLKKIKVKPRFKNKIIFLSFKEQLGSKPSSFYSPF